jgi:hypothetical protein
MRVGQQITAPRSILDAKEGMMIADVTKLRRRPKTRVILQQKFNLCVTPRLSESCVQKCASSGKAVANWNTPKLMFAKEKLPWYAKQFRWFAGVHNLSLLHNRIRQASGHLAHFELSTLALFIHDTLELVTPITPISFATQLVTLTLIL